ncbi:MAG: guanylate kinase [Bacteroidetes bacterium MED-G13]|nr:MAG: guanylate kinase [Bacteroidetes bacterium MED-G13]|tara:strand:- start:10002 stop:10568 length:567 start_codon:yes stop_codon:yes gene_type:complete
MNTNKFIIIAAPSGSGKSSIVNMLLNDDNLKLNFSTSATTRPKRVNEVDGKNYYFFTIEKFKEKIKNNEFVEWEEVYKDTFYGSLISELENTTNDIIFDIDVVGGLNIKKLFPNKSLTIFIKPPSIEELEVRLRARMSDNEASIIERVKKAKLEMQSINKFDHVVENNILDDCYKKVSNIVYSFINDK